MQYDRDRELGQERNRFPMNRGFQTTPKFHLKEALIPKYSGAMEKKSPYDFLIELEKYMSITRSSPEFIVYKVVPIALTGVAFDWYRFELDNVGFRD